MSYPQNPETIILTNEYYPEGLKEIDIWNYYQKNKNNLLRETLGKSLIVFFATDLNKTTVLRKNKSKGLIRLTPSDYNTIVSGRTLSFHSVMDNYSGFGIVDIDTDDFNKAKEATLELYNLLTRFKFANDLKVRFTGKNSFHIKIEFKNEYPIDYIKRAITEFLLSSNIDNKYTFLHKRIKNTPNIDLNRNVYNAGYITLYSLSVTGLRCMELPLNRVKNFRKENSKI